jgi:hypothetical protein
MITDTVSAIKREVLQLIDLQMESLKQRSHLDSSQLNDYQARSQRIRKLYEELDRIGPTQLPTSNERRVVDKTSIR